jgi:hypothetical protein
MARDFIKVDRTTVTATHAQKLLQYVSELRRALETGELILGVMNHNNDGEAWGDIEALFGLPAGKGQIVYNLMNGSVGSLKGLFQAADGKNITETVG